MKNLEKDIEILITTYGEAYERMQNIDDDNFDQTIKIVRDLLTKTKEMKEYLLKVYSINDLKHFDSELTKLTKLIKNCFDNIIEQKKAKLDETIVLIKQSQNKKKLVNYIR